MCIRIGIVGYGNLGRGVELALQQNPDMAPAAIFTRRNPKSLTPCSPSIPVRAMADIPACRDDIDALILCGGSATDLPEQTPHLAGICNVVDSFDTHAIIPEHLAATDAAARAAGTIALISAGWDPGVFSLNRLYSEAILPRGNTWTFWGKGVSQGHSDAIRRIPGVLDARQYTIPVESALEAVRSGSNPELTTRQKHTRVCYVVAAQGADCSDIERRIVTMPDYFADYDTTVHFVTADVLQRDHSGIPHGGFVIRSGRTGDQSDNTHIVEYRLKLDSNPEFTACVLVACARAAVRMRREGQCGARTLFDVPPAWLSPEPADDLIRRLL